MAETRVTRARWPALVASPLRWPLISRVLLCLAALAALALMADPGTRPASAPATRLAAISDYISGWPDQRTLFSLDPTTLADREKDSAFLAGPFGWALSGDGSTWVSIERTLGPEAATIVVRNGPTGAERARIQPLVPVCCPLLSHAGERLVVTRLHHEVDCGLIAWCYALTTARNGPLASWTLTDVNRATRPMQMRAWEVYDTATGQQLATATPPVEGEVWQTWLDAAGQRLYRLVIPGSPEDQAPRPVRLIAYSIMTGDEMGRLDLPGVLAGTFRPGGLAMSGQPLSLYLTPGAALAPDGRRLALAHADAELVTLVDVERLAVERTVALARRTGPLDWLGLAPQIAQAKEWREPGTTRQAAFSPDGRRLYIVGNTYNGITPHYLGLRVMDLQSGRVIAEVLADEWIDGVLPALEGQSLYVFGLEDDPLRWARPRQRVRRLDAGTLTVLADRTFEGPFQLVLWPGTAPPLRNGHGRV